MTIDECYIVLEITPGASPEDVRKAYKLLAAVWHPDRFPAGSKLHRDAEDKLRRINEAHDTLKQHLASGGSAHSAGPSPSVDDYVEQCMYLGGDPRIRDLTLLERGRPAAVQLAPEGITLLTVSGRDIEQAVHYPVSTLTCLDVRNITWSAPGLRFDPDKYKTPWQLESNRVVLHATDPDRIVSGFPVKLEFRNDYIAKLFTKRARKLFFPTNATQQCIEERARRAEERRAAQERKRREAVAQDRGHRTPFVTAAAILFGVLVLVWAVLVFAIFCHWQPPGAERDTAAPETTSMNVYEEELWKASERRPCPDPARSPSKRSLKSDRRDGQMMAATWPDPARGDTEPWH